MYTYKQSLYVWTTLQVKIRIWKMKQWTNTDKALTMSVKLTFNKLRIEDSKLIVKYIWENWKFVKDWSAVNEIGYNSNTLPIVGHRTIPEAVDTLLLYWKCKTVMQTSYY